MIRSKHTQATGLHFELYLSTKNALNQACCSNNMMCMILLRFNAYKGVDHKTPLPSAFYLAVSSVLLLQTLCL